MKKMKKLFSIVLVLAIVSPAIADFTDNFESYTVGSPLGSPWTGTNPLIVVSSYGYGGSKGVHGNSNVWFDNERATNYNTAEATHKLSWKARLSSLNGLARLNVGVGNAVSTIWFEMDENLLTIAYPGGNMPGVVKNKWYTLNVELFKDGGGNWSWAGSYAREDGITGIIGSGNLPAGFAPDKVKLRSIWAFAEPGGTSAIDEVSFQADPGYAPPTYGFTDNFDSYTTGAVLPAPWVSSAFGGTMMKVNESGFGGSKGTYSSDASWHWSDRSTNYNPATLQHNLTLKVLISSNNGLNRHEFFVGNAKEMIQCEFDQNKKWVEFGTPSSGWQRLTGLLNNTWYEFNVRVTNDGSGNWIWALLWRTWDGTNWGAWSVAGTGTTAVGFAPEIVTLGGIYGWNIGDPFNSAMDDVAFQASTQPADCNEQLARGYNLAGDLNNDCQVDFNDVSVMASTWVNCSEALIADCTPAMVDPPIVAAVTQGIAAIDGNLSEWAGANWIDLNLAYSGNANDPNLDLTGAKFAAMWSPITNKIYVAVTGVDTYQVFNPDYFGFDQQDAINIYVDADNGNETNWSGNFSTAQYYIISPNGTGGEWAYLGSNGVAIPGGMQFTYKTSVSGNILSYEAAITPYRNFNYASPASSTIVTLAAGQTLGLDADMDSAYTGGGFIMLTAHNVAGKYFDAGSFLDMKLLGPGAGMCGIWGYFGGDANKDCYVTLEDFALMASHWLGCSEPGNSACEQIWLEW